MTPDAQNSRVPANLTFEIDDAESEWSFQKNSFDLVHFQNMIGSIADWPKLVKNCYEFVLYIHRYE